MPFSGLLFIIASIWCNFSVLQDGYLRVNALLADKLLPLLQDDDIIWITIITCCHLRMNYANGE